jgi:hypothetical protein
VDGEIVDNGHRIMRSRARSNKKKYGPNIVRAWFATIFQYVLGRLESERGYLLRRNWTFRYYNRSLEYVASLDEHMPAIERANLEQFRSFFPEVNGLIEEHDNRVDELSAACASFHDAILRDGSFQQVLARIETEAQHEFGVDFSTHFGAVSNRADFAAVLAEYLVNNLEDLPSYYATSRLWNRFRERFIPVMASHEIESRRVETESRGRALLEIADKVIEVYKAIRFDLSADLDVPVAEPTSAA